MFNWGLMGGIYAMLHAVHGIADYWLQTDWQAQNKSKNVVALMRHVTTYSLCFLAVSAALYWGGQISALKAVLLPFVIGIPHAWMDRRKFLGWFLEKTKGWKPTDEVLNVPVVAAVRVHVTIHMDQKFHYLCLLLTAAWLAY